MNVSFDLRNQNDQAVLLRKVITDMCACIRLFLKHAPLNNIFVCFDAKEIFRKKINSTYKASRVKKEDEFYMIQQEIFEILIIKGINAMRIIDLEADDLCYLVSNKDGFINKEIVNVVITSDYDAHQLINENTVVYNDNSKSPKIFCEQCFDHTPLFYPTLADTISENKITIQFSYAFLTLCEKVFLGCEGDEVERWLPKGQGIKKIEKCLTSLKLLRLNLMKFNSIQQIDNLILILMAVGTDLGLRKPAQDYKHRLELVYLNKELYPIHSTEMWNNISFMLNSQVSNNMDDYQMPKLLQGTKYIHFV